MDAADPDIKRRRFVVLRNPFAGRGDARFVETVCGLLERAGASARVVETRCPDDAERVVAGLPRDEVDAIAVAGGDGAVRVAAGAQDEACPPLGLIPTGSANVLAEELGVAARAEAVARTLLTGQERAFALGRANGAPFLVIASVGFSGAAAAAAIPLKPYAGRYAYWGAIAWAAMTAPGRRLSVTVDGQTLAARGAFVTSARLRRKSLLAGGRAGMRLVLFDADHPPARAAIVAAIGAHALAMLPGVRVMPFKTALVEASPPAACQIDGEPFGATPVLFRADARPARFIVPAPAA